MSRAAKQPRQYRIVPKRDFRKGVWVNGDFVKQGFIVTDHGQNIMPGATWFRTVAEAMEALRILVKVKFDPDNFWAEFRQTFPS